LKSTQSSQFVAGQKLHTCRQHLLT